MVVEDNDVVRRLTCRILTRHGYRTLEARNATEALRLAQERKDPIHLLLTDIVMPGMSGQQLAARLGAHHPETKVLFMSGYAEEAVAGYSVLAPGTIYLQKPFTSKDLLDKVRRVLEAKN